MNEASFIQDALNSRPYVKVYGKAAIEKWAQRNRRNRHRVDLPFVDPPTKEELGQRRGKGNVYDERLTERLLQRITEHGSLEDIYPYGVQVVRFGDDLSLVALAGEVVVDYVLLFRKQFEGQRIWVVGLVEKLMQAPRRTPAEARHGLCCYRHARATHFS